MYKARIECEFCASIMSVNNTILGSVMALNFQELVFNLQKYEVIDDNVEISSASE